MDNAEPETIDPATFDTLQRRLKEAGPTTAVAELCETLRAHKDYAKLFYALLMQKRVAMGVSPIPTGTAGNFTPAQQEDYETAIRSACRTVGQLFLDAGNIPHAFSYFRMIGEVAPVAEALNRYQPGPDEDVQPLIDVAYYQGANPQRGFDLVLERYGICNAITTVSSYDPAHGLAGRNYCITQLVKALHSQLVERLQAAIDQQQGFPPTAKSIPELINGRDWLFADDSYYTDTSHLSSVVQMSVELEDPEILRLACELCAYGQKLGPTLQYPGNPPFEDLYRDVEKYLKVLLAEDVEAGLAHFRAKITADPDGPDTFAAEVLVKLLLRLDRPKDALAVAREYFVNVDERQLGVPGVFELSQRVQDYQTLAETARARNDPVHFLAGLIAAK